MLDVPHPYGKVKGSYKAVYLRTKRIDICEVGQGAVYGAAQVCRHLCALLTYLPNDQDAVLSLRMYKVTGLEHDVVAWRRRCRSTLRQITVRRKQKKSRLCRELPLS